MPPPPPHPHAHTHWADWVLGRLWKKKTKLKCCVQVGHFQERVLE